MKNQIVEVTWLDAQSGFSSPLSIEEIINEAPVLTKSAGYLIHKDKEKIVLGFMQWDNNMFKHWQLIPMGIVKEIKYLKEGKHGIQNSSKYNKSKRTR